ncbi:MAG: arylsulfatase, partial [Bacteroidota bacterium]
YGQKDIRTPFLDRMAEEGMRFTNHYAGSTVSAPSRCALMTGRHMGHAYIRGNGAPPLPAEKVTVAELLKNAGYKTGLIGKWGLGEKNSSGHPMNQGFDLFVGYLNQIRAHNSYPAWMWSNRDTMHLDNEVKIIPETYAKGIGGVATEKNTHSHDVFMREATQFINANRDTSFFLYLALTIPHANNEAGYWDMIGMETPDMMGYDTTDWPRTQQAHASMISYMDRDIGELLNQLEKLGIDDKTLVIFTSDNGPHKEGGADPAFFDSWGPLRGFKRDLYEGGIRVPMIAWWPGKIEAGTTSGHISAFWDFLPTACEVAEAETPDNIDGISFLPELLGQQQKKHDHLYWEINIGGGRQAARKGKWKAIRYNVSEAPEKPVELYDLSKDIGETNNVAGQYPEVSKDMFQLMKHARVKPSVENFMFEFEK